MKKGLIFGIAMLISSDYAGIGNIANYQPTREVIQVEHTPSAGQTSKRNGYSLTKKVEINSLVEKLSSLNIAKRCNFTKTIIKLSELKSAHISEIYLPEGNFKDAPTPVWILSAPFSETLQENIYNTLTELMEIMPFNTLGIMHEGDELTAKELMPPGWYESWKDLNKREKRAFGLRRVTFNKANGSEMFEVSFDEDITTYGLNVSKKEFDIFNVFQEDLYMERLVCSHFFKGQCPIPEDRFISRKIPDVEKLANKVLKSWAQQIAKAQKISEKDEKVAIVPFVADYHTANLKFYLQKQGPHIILMPNSFTHEMTSKWKDGDGQRVGYQYFWGYWFMNGHRRFKLE